MEKTILIADDDRAIVELLKEGIASKGYNVVTAYDGKSAIDLIRLHRPDLAILDVMMPNIDGFALELKAREKEELKRMPVILITGEPGVRGLFDRIRIGRINGWFYKPIKMNKLLKKIKNILE